MLEALVRLQLPATTDPATLQVVDSVGRTEDVVVDPAGGRLALACFELDAIALVGFEIDRAGGRVTCCDAEILRSPGLARPHGLAFADDDTLVVANRESEVLIVDISATTRSGDGVAPDRVVLDRRSNPPVRSPGSLAVTWISDRLLEVIVCNNYAHDVTRHVLDRDDDWAVVDGEVLLERGLSVPDGVATDANGSWLAISNHLTHTVHMYRYDVALGPSSEPDGVLQGSNFAHGLSFSPDGRHLLVADAGLPYLMTYSSNDGDWSGARGPTTITRVMDDHSFNRGRVSPQEGGPKGLALTADGDVVITSEFQTVAVFSLPDLTASAAPSDTEPAAELGDDAGPTWVDVSHQRSAGRAEQPRRRRWKRLTTRAGVTGASVIRSVAGRVVLSMPSRWRHRTMNLSEELAEFIRKQQR